MKIVITGATGYIGSALVCHLERAMPGADLFLTTDRVPPFFEHWVREKRLRVADILDESQLLDSMPEGLDAVVHLASYNDQLTAKDPKGALLVNGFGTRNVLNAARKRGAKHVVYFSTLQVYGKSWTGTISADSPLDCRDDYAVTHRVGEIYCEMAANAGGMAVSILRPANIFGAPLHRGLDRWTLVPNCLCMDAWKTGSITLKSSGLQGRDFVPLGYVCESVSELLAKPPEGLGIYNVSSQHTFTILDMAKACQRIGSEMLGRNITLKVDGASPVDTDRFEIINNLMPVIPPEELRRRLDGEIKKIYTVLLEG